MKLPEHVAFSFLLAHLGPQQQYGWGGTALVVAAGLLPDLDGLTVLGGWGCHRRYHRVLGHGLPVTLGGPLALALAGAALLGVAWLPLWCWLQLSLLLHLATDVLFYRWPVQLLWPLSPRGAGLGRVPWNDLTPTTILYVGCAAVLVRPDWGVAAAFLGLLGLYVLWRSARRPALTGWGAWLAGDWARRAPRVCRWLTGDFVPCPYA